MGKGARRVFEKGTVAGVALLVAATVGCSNVPGHLGRTTPTAGGAPFFAAGVDGAVYVGSAFAATKETGEISSGDAGGTLVRRMRPDGRPDWAKMLNGVSATLASVNPKLHDGSSVIAGSDAVTKLDASGDPIWTAPCTGWRCDDQTTDVAATADGGAVLLTQKLVSGSASGLYRVVRFSASGDVSWIEAPLQNGSTCFQNWFERVIEAPDGTVLLGGNLYPGSCDFPAPWHIGLIITRLDAAGRQVDVRTVDEYEKDSYAWFTDLAVGPDGAVFATGEYYSPVDFDNGPGVARGSAGPGVSGFAIKMRPDFSLLRLADIKLEGGTGSPELAAVAPDGGLVLVEHRSNAIKGVHSDPHLVKLDADLRYKWELPVGNQYTIVEDLTIGGDVINLVVSDYDGSLTGTPDGSFLDRYLARAISE